MRTFACMLLALCAVAATPALADDLPRVLFPGPVQGLDLPNIGQDIKSVNYIALYEKGGKFFLGEARVTFEMENIKSTQPDAIVFMRGLRLKTGEVPTATISWKGMGNSVTQGSKPRQYFHIRGATDEVGISFNSQAYSIARGKSGFILRGTGGKTVMYKDNEDLIVLWAGDLDGDGKLDLIVESTAFEGKNAVKCVWLSSRAKVSELVVQYDCMLYSG